MPATLLANREVGMGHGGRDAEGGAHIEELGLVGVGVRENGEMDTEEG